MKWENKTLDYFLRYILGTILVRYHSSFDLNNASSQMLQRVFRTRYQQLALIKVKKLKFLSVEMIDQSSLGLFLFPLQT